MARSFTNSKVFSALILDRFSQALSRRGYSVATRGGVGSMSRSSKMTSKPGEEKGTSTYKVSWVPDPVTGYYKPENIEEIDVADLRSALLPKNFNN
ncbi:indole-3-acetic acid-induced protein ARG2 [Cajanus cajan]|uniref:Indole-3-acetic acid-induced protein ARG2 n=1 Tax=Cajanus cajan TaxID=3821 RepID=A0A151TXU2_CAJCA|nr:indole-3-acetic acid-induced protein ARG2 [Cajanus cajan]KYP71856.1 Indole-3-acetic acid-induced protein ARG2 [Cajanus cajan]